jgi:NADH-quinone oxidoreductase subunit M
VKILLQRIDRAKPAGDALPTPPKNPQVKAGEGHA